MCSRHSCRRDLRRFDVLVDSRAGASRRPARMLDDMRRRALGRGESPALHRSRRALADRRDARLTRRERGRISGMFDRGATQSGGCTAARMQRGFSPRAVRPRTRPRRRHRRRPVAPGSPWRDPAWPRTPAGCRRTTRRPRPARRDEDACGARATVATQAPEGWRAPGEMRRRSGVANTVARGLADGRSSHKPRGGCYHKLLCRIGRLRTVRTRSRE